MKLNLLNLRAKKKSGANDGFTLIEMLVVIAIIAILAGFFLPSLPRAKEKGKQAGCVSNLRQIYLAVVMHADDNENYLPPKFELKKAALKPEDIAKGKQLNTSTHGIQTALGDTVYWNLFTVLRTSVISRAKAPFGNESEPVAKSTGANWTNRKKRR